MLFVAPKSTPVPSPWLLARCSHTLGFSPGVLKGKKQPGNFLQPGDRGGGLIVIDLLTALKKITR